MRRLFLALFFLLAAGSLATLAAFRAGLIASRPELLAGLVIALAGTLGIELAYLCARARHGELRRGGAFGRGLLLGGVLLALGGGTANWLLSLQGYLVLVEGETARLGAGGQLEGLEVGPLGDPRELEIDLALTRVDLTPAGGNTFDPVSFLETRRKGAAIAERTVGGGRIAEIGPIRIRQGAFGYAPRIVITRGDETIFDRVVPFTTRRDGSEGTQFAADLHLEKEGLDLRCEVSLDTLDERLQGHPTLRLAVRRGDAALGAGDLLPGQFAALSEGYRVGFTGLKKWSEIDVARRNYPGPMFAGFAIALVGAILWPLAAWRRW